jgi:uncharacterized membrane protein HdeD (DUF308 family)
MTGPTHSKGVSTGRYDGSVPEDMAERMGWLRAAVGVALIVAPGGPLRLSNPHGATGASRLLLRTIGIRDLVLGLGMVAAARSPEVSETRRWTTMTLASDSLDVVASLASMRSIGKRDSVLAAALAAVFVVKDVSVMRALFDPKDETELLSA